MKWRAMVCGLLLIVSATSCARHEGHESKGASSSSDSATASVTSSAARAVRVSAEKTEAAEPAAASGLDGTVYVAWVEHRGGKEADVWLSHFDGEGRPLGSPARVNPNAGEATAWRGDPPTVAVAQDGTVYVGWTARDEGAAHASALYLSASRDGGRSFAPPSKVNDDAKPGVHGMHSLAVSGDGRVYVAWLDERNVAPKPAANAPSHMHTESNRELFFASSVDKGRTFSPNLRVAGEVCPCCKTSLAVAGDGRVYVGWRQVLPGDYRHIAVASTADGGRTFSSPVVVSDDGWQIAGCPVSGAAFAVGAGGELRVLWYTEGEAGRPGLYWSESRDGGRSFSPRRAFVEGDGRGTPVLTNGASRDLIAVWDGGDSPARPMAARLSEDGRVGDRAALADTGQLPAAASAGGRLFVAYISETDGGRSVWLARSEASDR
jgi:hypothetical protein